MDLVFAMFANLFPFAFCFPQATQTQDDYFFAQLLGGVEDRGERTLDLPILVDAAEESKESPVGSSFRGHFQPYLIQEFKEPFWIRFFDHGYISKDWQVFGLDASPRQTDFGARA